MLAHPLDAQEGTRIVHDKHDIFIDPQLFPQREQKAAILSVGVAVGARVEKFLGIAHPDHVAGNQPAQATTGRHDVAPQIG